MRPYTLKFAPVCFLNNFRVPKPPALGCVTLNFTKNFKFLRFRQKPSEFTKEPQKPSK